MSGRWLRRAQRLGQASARRRARSRWTSARSPALTAWRAESAVLCASCSRSSRRWTSSDLPDAAALASLALIDAPRRLGGMTYRILVLAQLRSPARGRAVLAGGDRGSRRAIRQRLRRAWLGRRGIGQAAHREPLGQRWRRAVVLMSSMDVVRRARSGERRQVSDHGSRLGACLGRVQSPDPLIKLVHGQPAFRRMLAEHARDLISVGVADPQRCPIGGSLRLTAAGHARTLSCARDGLSLLLGRRRPGGRRTAPARNRARGPRDRTQALLGGGVVTG